MNQPGLGKKIAELRKAKKLTQKELVDKCNLNVRTIQRIESGEVEPRGYTIKLIFKALDYQSNDLDDSPKNWLEKKSPFSFKVTITVLLFTFSLVLTGLYVMYSTNKTQSISEIKNSIRESQNNIVKWVNSGKTDAILTKYRSDACVLQSLCGKENIKKALDKLINNGYKIIKYNIVSISVSDSIAVEKYNATYTYRGNTRKQTGVFEWRFSNGKWLIVNDMYNEN